MLQSKDKLICPHYPRVLLQRSLPKIQQDLQRLQQLHKKQAIKCAVCDFKIEHPNLCLKCQTPLCDIEQGCVHEHSKNNGTLDHSISINIFTTMLICVICKTEVLDFEQYGLTGNEECFAQWINPQRLRIEYHRYFFKPETQLIKQNSIHCGILNVGNSSYINCVLQVMLNLPTIQKIFERLNQEFENYPYQSKSNRKKLLRQLCLISEAFRTKNQKIINPIDLIKTLSGFEQKFLGYGKKDAYDFFKFLINFLHEEFKFTNRIDYNKKIPFQNDQPIGNEWDIIAQPQHYKDFSFIQNIFSGELKATLQCQSCSKVSLTTDNYSALSLEIPEHHNESFLNKLYWGLKTKLTTDRTSVTLYDCLHLIYEPTLDPGTSCTCGGKGNKRQYAFHDYSNLLSIHIQRLTSKGTKDTTHVKFPIEKTDFASYFNINGVHEYVLFAVIIHISRSGGDHYETILNLGNNMFAAIRDELVIPVTLKYVSECEASMLFYQRVPNGQAESTKHNLLTNKALISAGELKFSDEELCLLPNFWLEQFTTLARPSMIITSHYICPHNNLRPDYWDFRQYLETTQSILNSSVQDVNTSFFQNYEEKQEINEVKKISSSYAQLQLTSTVFPSEVCKFLIEKYGGGPAIPKNIQICQQCIDNAQIMSKRRKLERRLIQKYEDSKQQRVYIINEQWLRKWQLYLYNSKAQLQQNCIFGMPPPGEINNTVLVDQYLIMQPHRKEGIDYSLISTPIWKILHALYGGNPDLTIEQNLEPFQLDSEDLNQIKEMKQLYQLCCAQQKS